MGLTASDVIRGSRTRERPSFENSRQKNAADALQLWLNTFEERNSTKSCGARYLQSVTTVLRTGRVSDFVFGMMLGVERSYTRTLS